MKALFKMILGAVCLAGLLAVPFQGSAVQITYGERGVGGWSPASALNSDADALLGVELVVSIWNGRNAPGDYHDGAQSITFTKGSGTEVPASLNPPSAFGSKVEGDLRNWPGLDNTLGEFLYMLGKYGNTSYVFYIGNLQEPGITLPLDFGAGTGDGLSHVSWFRGTGDISVPDGGTTALLLGAVMVGFAALRRKLA